MMSYLGVLQSVGAARWTRELEELLGHHPGLQSLQLAGSQVGGMMLHQVTLELIKQEVDMDSHRMSHCIVPGEGSQGTVIKFVLLHEKTELFFPQIMSPETSTFMNIPSGIVLLLEGQNQGET